MHSSHFVPKLSPHISFRWRGRETLRWTVFHAYCRNILPAVESKKKKSNTADNTCVIKMQEMEEVLQSVGQNYEVKLLFNGTALMFLFSQASSRGDGNNSDVNSSSSDMLDIILHEDSCSGTGSATSGSMGSGSNGCGTSASGTSNSGTSKSRTSGSGTSASGTSGSGTGLFQHLVYVLR